MFIRSWSVSNAASREFFSCLTYINVRFSSPSAGTISFQTRYSPLCVLQRSFVIRYLCSSCLAADVGSTVQQFLNCSWWSVVRRKLVSIRYCWDNSEAADQHMLVADDLLKFSDAATSMFFCIAEPDLSAEMSGRQDRKNKNTGQSARKTRPLMRDLWIRQNWCWNRLILNSASRTSFFTWKILLKNLLIASTTVPLRLVTRSIHWSENNRTIDHIEKFGHRKKLRISFGPTKSIHR